MRAHLPKDQPRSRARASVPATSAVGSALPTSQSHNVTVINKDGSKDIHAAEEAMLADIGLYNGANQRRQHLVTVETLLKEHQKKDDRSSAIGGSTRDISESELMASMAARLSALERIGAQQANLMRDKDENIRSLTAQLVILQQHAQAGEAVAHMEEENMRLKRQIHEMETFLNDYGLVWAGFRADQPDDDDLQVLDAPSTSSSTSGSGSGSGSAGNAATAVTDNHDKDTKTEIYFDIKLAMASLKDLNHLAGEGHMKIVAERGVAKFQPPEAVSLIFYKNGIFFKNGPLRSYSMPECQAFVRDILEGYFPYELKGSYPDGVVFAATDRSTEIHGSSVPKFQAFGGVGNRLAGTTVVSSAAISTNSTSGSAGSTSSSSSNVTTISSTPNSVTTEQFLNKLPSSVVSNGKVIEVRSDIGRLLHAADRVTPGAAGGNTLILVRTPIIEQMQRTDGRPATPGDIATLRVQADDGAPPLLIKLRFHDTIATLRSFIDRERKSSSSSSSSSSSVSSSSSNGWSLTYDLRTNFPSKLYNIVTQSLQEAGLVPNATLLLRSKPSATPS